MTLWSTIGIILEAFVLRSDFNFQKVLQEYKFGLIKAG